MNVLKENERFSLDDNNMVRDKQMRISFTKDILDETITYYKELLESAQEARKFLVPKFETENYRIEGEALFNKGHVVPVYKDKTSAVNAICKNLMDSCVWAMNHSKALEQENQKQVEFNKILAYYDSL